MSYRNNQIGCQIEIITKKWVRKLVLILSIWSIPTLFAAEAEAEWTVVVYAQANNSLSPFAQKNFNDIASISSSNDLNVLVQWHDPTHNGVWRYKIENGKMNLDIHLPIKTDGNAAKDLVDSMNWAITKYPAKKYALILWNHGIGIVDPVWGSQSMGFARSDRIVNNPRIQINGISYTKEKKIKNKHKKNMLKGGHRGILFNEATRTYMNNQTLSSALSAIKTNLLKGKKIDLLGMDACLMAMVEVCYQVHNYADYFVGSQEVELAFGWSYAPIIQKFINKPTAQEAAQNIVQSYENLYKNKINFYTQSAVDLNLMEDLRDSINLIVHKLTICREFDPHKVITMLKQARSRSLQFSTTSYIDLHSFLQELQRSSQAHINKNTVKNNSFIDAAAELYNALDIAIKFTEQTVIANTVGKQLSRARGLSVYFPIQGPIDQSYLHTDFASDTAWKNLLMMTQGF